MKLIHYGAVMTIAALCVCMALIVETTNRNDRRRFWSAFWRLAVSARYILLYFLIAALFLACCVGCTSERAIIVTPTIPVRTAEVIEGVEVFVKKKDGSYVKATADIPAGVWFVMDPAEWDTERRADAMNLGIEEDGE